MNLAIPIVTFLDAKIDVTLNRGRFLEIDWRIIASSGMVLGLATGFLLGKYGFSSQSAIPKHRQKPETYKSTHKSVRRKSQQKPAHWQPEQKSVTPVLPKNFKKPVANLRGYFILPEMKAQGMVQRLGWGKSKKRSP